MYWQILAFLVYTISLCMNIEAMLKLYTIHHQLFCFIVGNMGLITFDTLLMYIFRRIVSLNNNKTVFNVSIYINIIINLYGVWGFIISVDKSVDVPGLFGDGDLHQTSFWKIMYLTIETMIWLRLFVIIYYCFVLVLVIVCLPFFLLDDYPDTNTDKVSKDNKMIKFLEANSRAFDEKCDAERTCPICLDDFSNTKDEQIT